MDRRDVLQIASTVTLGSLAGCTKFTSDQDGNSSNNGPTATSYQPPTTEQTSDPQTTEECSDLGEKMPDLEISRGGAPLEGEVVIQYGKYGEDSAAEYYRKSFNGEQGRSYTERDIFEYKGGPHEDSDEGTYFIVVRTQGEEWTSKVSTVAHSPYRYGIKVKIRNEPKGTATAAPTDITTHHFDGPAPPVCPTPTFGNRS